MLAVLDHTRKRVAGALPLLVVTTVLFDVITIRSVEPVAGSRLLLWLFLYFLLTFALLTSVYVAYAYLNEVAQRDV